MAAIKMKPPREVTPTEVAIADAILLDGGARFRVLQQKWLPLIKDAYNAKVETGRRSHYGFSGAGGGFPDRCERALWLQWRWQDRPEFVHVPAGATHAERVKGAAMHRLVNRGHLEEARFMALLELIGVHIQEPEDGQERVSYLNGHAGSALDAILFNSPCVPNEWHLGEFKTSNDKGFKSLQADGCKVAKKAHFVQMQLCMATRGIHKTLYMVVNKNDDNIHTEVIVYDEAFARAELALIEKIVFAPVPGAKISNDPSWFGCKYCDCVDTCQTKTFKPERTCRGCVAASPNAHDSGWRCLVASQDIPKDVMLVGCDSFRAITY